MEYSSRGMFEMWDVGNVKCSGCGMFGMWDVDLQNATENYVIVLIL